VLTLTQTTPQARPASLAPIGAGFNGGSFLNYHEDFSSMLHAVGFAMATAAYVALLDSMRRRRPLAPAAQTRSE
jgi:hypothetical protein